jgi:hypothetical protein
LVSPFADMDFFLAVRPVSFTGRFYLMSFFLTTKGSRSMIYGILMRENSTLHKLKLNEQSFKPFFSILK